MNNDSVILTLLIDQQKEVLDLRKTLGERDTYIEHLQSEVDAIRRELAAQDANVAAASE